MWFEIGKRALKAPNMSFCFIFFGPKAFKSFRRLKIGFWSFFRIFSVRKLQINGKTSKTSGGFRFSQEFFKFN